VWLKKTESKKMWQTAISNVGSNKIHIRGYPVEQLIGCVSYAQMVYLVIKGELPSEGEAKLLDAILVSSIDHGVTPPSTFCARNVASTGAELNSCVSAGILAISRYHGGAIEACMDLLLETEQLKYAQKLPDSVAAKRIIQSYREEDKRLAGFGHRLHTADPRTKKLFEVAKQLGFAGEYVVLAQTLEKELASILGKRLPLNVDGAIAALLCELDFEPVLANGFFMIARLPGLLAHIYEEKSRYKPMRKIVQNEVEYDGPDERPVSSLRKGARGL
jgi:citrate synthase